MLNTNIFPASLASLRHFIIVVIRMRRARILTRDVTQLPSDRILPQIRESEPKVQPRQIFTPSAWG